MQIARVQSCDEKILWNWKAEKSEREILEWITSYHEHYKLERREISEKISVYDRVQADMAGAESDWSLYWVWAFVIFIAYRTSIIQLWLIISIQQRARALWLSRDFSSMLYFCILLFCWVFSVLLLCFVLSLSFARARLTRPLWVVVYFHREFSLSHHRRLCVVLPIPTFYTKSHV